MAERQEFTPETLAEAAALLLACGGPVRPSPEGSALVGPAGEGSRASTIVLRLERLAELNRLEYDERSGLRIGAAVPYATLLEFPPVRRLYPILADGCAAVLRAKLPGQVTPGGSFSNLPLPPELAVPLCCLRGTTAILGPHGWSEVGVEALAAAPGRATVQAGEFFVDLRLPAPAPRSSGAYLRSKYEGEALPGGAAAGAFLAMEEDLVTCCGLRLILCFPPAAPRRLPEVERFLAGRRLEEAILEEAGFSAAQSGIGPGGGRALRLDLGRLVRHTILEALTRIRAAVLL